jgi:hypothetical protein
MLEVPRTARYQNGKVGRKLELVPSFVAIALTGLALIAPGAHLYELAHKISMTADQYFVVQGIYRGWWLAGLLLPAAFLANCVLAAAARDDAAAFAAALTAAALIVLNLVIFFIWTQPANAASENWTMRPENWEALRRQWEYSHAINAGVTFAAFCAATLAGLRATARL